MAHAELVGDKIILNTRYDEREIVSLVPGGEYAPRERHWRFPLSWASCVTLRGVFRDAERDLSLGSDLIEWGWETKADVDLLRRAREWLEWPSEWALEGGPESDPRLYPFQRVGAWFLIQAREALLGDEMGSGKTIQTIAALRTLGTDALPAVVICPNSVKIHWANKLREWYPGVIPYVVSGGVQAKRKIFERARMDPKAVVIINIEAVRKHSRLASYGNIALRRCERCDRRAGERIPVSACNVHPRELNVHGYRTVIVDEAHRIADPRAQQTRAIWAVAHGDTVEYRWGLTGTPLVNNPGDLWSIMHTIAPLEYPVRSKFLDRYCYRAWNLWGGMQVLGLRHDTRDEFYSFFDPRFRRVTKSQVLPWLPPKTRTIRHVDLSTKQLRVYREMEDGLVSRLPDGQLLIARSNLAAAIRLMQFSSAMVRIDERPDPENAGTWKVTLCEPSPKLDALEEVLDELGDRQVVVAAEHRQLIELAAIRLAKKNVSHALIVGGMTEVERDRSLKDLNEGRIRVLLFTIKAGGTGLDMSAVDTIVFLQRSWSMVDNVQAEDRVHRIGSEKHERITVVDVISDDTVEETQVRRLYEKSARLEEINRDRERLTADGRSVDHLDTEAATILETWLGEA